jgi:nitrate reductase NapE
MQGVEQQSKDPTPTFTKAQELRSFLFLSVVMAPVLAVMLVGGYGFLVWMYQLVAGPPGS